MTRRVALRRAAGGTIQVIFVAALVAVVWARWDDLAVVFEDPGRDLALIAALVVVGHFLNSSEFWLLYRAQGVPIRLWENWMVFTAGQLGNLLPGQLGTVYRFRYLKVVHDLPYTRSGSSFGANLVITLASSGVAGLVGLVGYWLSGGTVRTFVVVAVGALIVGSFVLALVPLPDSPWSTGLVARVWRGFRSGWEDLRRQPAVASQVLVIDLAKYVLVAWRFQLAFSLLGVDEPIWYFLVIAPAAGIAGAISFTPGGLGIREALVTFAAVGMGSQFDVGLLAATVDRGVMLATALVMGTIGYAYCTHRMRTIAKRDPATG